MKMRILAEMLLLMLFLSACVKEQPAIDLSVQITLVKSDQYHLSDGYSHQTEVNPGEEVRFVLYPTEGYVITGTDYPSSRVSDGPARSKILVLPAVRYPARVSVVCEMDADVRAITYDSNTSEKDTFHLYHRLNGHLYPNTAAYDGRFYNEKHTLLGWNTDPGGNGVSIGMGSRCYAASEEGLTLYAQWLPWNSEAEFEFQEAPDGYVITSYRGKEPQVVIPEAYNGLPVVGIAAEAFTDLKIDILSLPASLNRVEDRTFVDCTIRDLYFFDTLMHISDAAFVQTEFPRVHINAAQPPRYAGSGRASNYADKVDLLYQKKSQKKVVIFGGSGTYYSVLAWKMQELLDDEYAVINMGMNGWFPIMPQMSILRTYMDEGDILLHIPEEASGVQLFALTDFAMNVDDPKVFDDRFMRSLELNYDLISLFDLNESQGFFDSYSRFNNARQNQEPTDYADYSHYINENGDYPGRKLSYDQDEAITREADICPEFLTSETLTRMNAVYESFRQKGIRIAVAYAAVNESSLMEQSDYKQKAEQFDSILRSSVENAAVIEHIEDSFYNGSVFYNSDWHLSEEADIQNTTVITSGLKEFLRIDGN